MLQRKSIKVFKINNLTNEDGNVLWPGTCRLRLDPQGQSRFYAEARMFYGQAHGLDRDSRVLDRKTWKRRLAAGLARGRLTIKLKRGSQQSRRDKSRALGARGESVFAAAAHREVANPQGYAMRLRAATAMEFRMDLRPTKGDEEAGLPRGDTAGCPRTGSRVFNGVPMGLRPTKGNESSSRSLTVAVRKHISTPSRTATVRERTFNGADFHRSGCSYRARPCIRCGFELDSSMRLVA